MSTNAWNPMINNNLTVICKNDVVNVNCFLELIYYSFNKMKNSKIGGYFDFPKNYFTHAVSESNSYVINIKFNPRVCWHRISKCTDKINI